MHRTADRLLAHLQLAREAPTLDYLHRLVREHQRRVPFETLTKIVDWEPGRARGDFMPPMDLYVERIGTRGAGGLCWTLARGFHFLLTDLGFDAAHMLMAPGHCCVRVELPEGPFYADVGYAAPLFAAYPLFTSFTVETPRERFAYDVGDGGIVITRTPGPTKTLDPAPRRFGDLSDLIVAANRWEAPQSFLHRLAIGRWVDDAYVHLSDGTLRRFHAGGTETTTIDPADAPGAVAEVFGADPDLYREAERIHRRYFVPRTEPAP